MRYSLIFLLLVLFNLRGEATTFQGKVVCSESNKPLQFVNIGIPFCNIGTMTDCNGTFSIDINSSYNNHKVLFSCIGYRDTFLLVNNLKDTTNIKMTPAMHYINPIDVKYYKMHSKCIGYTVNHNSDYEISLVSDSLTNVGLQIAAFIPNRLPVILKSFKFSVLKSSYDSILLRINIYEVEGKLNHTKWSRNVRKSVRKNEDVYLTWNEIELYRNKIADKEKILGHKPLSIYLYHFDVDQGIIEVDLSNHNLTAAENILVGIEIAEYTQDGEIVFAGVKKNKRGLVRRFNHALWSELPEITPSFSLEVSSKKRKLLK